MKILVVYYSRTGNTKKAALQISRELRAQTDEIIDLKDRKMKIVGWLVSGRDASKGSLTEIKCKKDPSKFDLVIVGTPIWAWTLTPAIRTYLAIKKFKKVAFFCTCGGDSGKAFVEMQRLSKKPVATLVLSEKDLKGSRVKVKEFCKRLRSNP
jgi:flavodoxin